MSTLKAHTSSANFWKETADYSLPTKIPKLSKRKITFSQFSYFNDFSCPYFGNVGTVSPDTVILKRGLEAKLQEFPPSMESQFRQLGLQIKLDNGKYYLLDDYVVCEEGKEITADQSKMIVSLSFLTLLETFRNTNG